MLSLDVNGSLVVHAPAKLNLFLEILGKRNDGYHELETLMVTVGWYDTLVVRPLDPDRGTMPAQALPSVAANRGDEGVVGRLASWPDQEAAAAAVGPGAASLPSHSIKEEAFGPVRLTCRAAGSPGGRLEAASIPTGGDNLVVRAARLLQEATGFRGGIAIELVKRIPMAAGLAGGSSDAAAALWACNRVWRLGLSTSELMGLAARLGSDIPFFLAGMPAAVCRGRGELVEPVALPAGLSFVIARPAGGLSTALVYRNCRPSPSPVRVGPLLEHLRAHRLTDAGRLLHNALQEPAEKLSREISELKELFSREPVPGHRMSGSGTAYFALCAHLRQARQVAARLRSAGVPHVAVVQSRT